MHEESGDEEYKEAKHLRHLQLLVLLTIRRLPHQELLPVLYNPSSPGLLQAQHRAFTLKLRHQVGNIGLIHHCRTWPALVGPVARVPEGRLVCS